ncbi:hypothetical protein UFOVP264_29 [uncultured Caudovirales phage]|uniref:Uncharacterized protein n=1 Tax=uncultured Caudovirales phage TaxID=2100421 RepID=A0A6J5LKD6_9CAUD|nr:hypothetical protein UFOVP264_29 [uncultured Caudovirales phage]
MNRTKELNVDNMASQYKRLLREKARLEALIRIEKLKEKACRQQLK